jgi:hypothetical protein
MIWAKYPTISSPVASPESSNATVVDSGTPFAVQLVQQVNYGPLESKRYFIPASGETDGFIEIIEDNLIQANFKKLNSYVYSYPILCIMSWLLISSTGIRTSNVRIITSSSKSTSIRRILSTYITGGLILLGQGV